MTNMKLMMENWRKFEALQPDQEQQEPTSEDFCTNYPDACKEAYGTVRSNMPQIGDADDFETELGAEPGEGLETNEPEKIPDLGMATKDYLSSSDDQGEWPAGDQVSVNTETDIDPMTLKPTQKDIYMSNALKKAQAGEDPNSSWKPWNASVLVSEDGYLLDGHHRWAATIIYNEKHPDDLKKMSIERVMMPIKDLLGVANAYTDATGAPRAGGGETTV